MTDRANGQGAASNDTGGNTQRTLITVLGIAFILYPILVAHGIFAVWPAVEAVSAAGGAPPAATTKAVTLVWRTFDLTPGQAYYLLMVVFGIAGAYVATATSFATYVGNQTFKASWGWWYALRPFIGAGVAVILMIAILGGLVAVTSQADALDPVNLNPYTVAAFSALAGWFSKTASDKLEEIFQTILSNSKDEERSDKLESKDDAGSAPGAVEIIEPAGPAHVEVGAELAITVRVVDGLEAGQPTDAAGNEMATAAVRSTEPRAGRYVFTATAPGEYLARFFAPELQDALLPITVVEPATGPAVTVIAVDDTEEPAESEVIESGVTETVVVDVEPIEGLSAPVVTDLAGRPLEDVKIEASPGEDGQFMVTPTKPGTVKLAFSAPDAAPATVTLDVKPKGKFTGVYIVRTGDVLSRIARRYDTTVAELMEENPQITDADEIRVGDRINVPLVGEPGTLQPIVIPDIEDDDDTPVWMAIAERELDTGVREVKGGRHNPRIVEYHRATTLGSSPAGGRDETPWCSSFVNFCMQQAGITGTRSARARSWLKWKNGEELTEPRHGCVVVFSRPPKPAHGHVAFFVEEDGDRVVVLGGNQRDQVSVKAYPKSRLLGYFWPKEAPPPPPSIAVDVEPETDWSQVELSDRCRYVMNLLTDKYGYPTNAAAGIVGNLMAESGVIPNRLEGSRAATPMQSEDIDGEPRTWTAAEVMDRIRGQRGPRRPGVGLAQWTSKNRRAGLFDHEYEGTELGAGILFDMDAQVDYLVEELGSDYVKLDRELRDPGVTVETAAAEVVYRYEVPGSVLGKASGKTVKRPRSDPRVQQVFAQRVKRAHEALASVAT